jgi:hypothetical protein
MVSVDFGYRSTTSSQFGDGFAYGLGLTEGKGKVGFGIKTLRFANTCRGDTATVNSEGQVFTAEFEDHFVDFFITFMGTYHLNAPSAKNRFTAGVGPQVHFVNSSRKFSTFSYSDRDFRIGAGALIMYRRRIDMFGDTALVVTASYSHMQSVDSRTDLYEVPTRSMDIATLTAGIAFPF